MKLSPSIITLVVSAMAVSAFLPRDSTISQGPRACATPQSNVAGAVYFLTNEPDGNFIVGSEIGLDGRLTFKGAVSAGGRGAHDLPDPTTFDALFTQGVIRVSGDTLFTVNPGSNTLVMFTINKSEPAKLTMVGHPVDTGGEFPVSVTISKQTGQVCVLNGGRVNGVNCFKQDSKLGLSQMDNTQRPLHLNQTTPATGPPGTVSHVLFSEDGSQLIAAVKGTPSMSGFLAVWDVDAETGALSNDFAKLTPAAGGLSPFGMTVIPGKKALLVTDLNIGFEVFELDSGKNTSNSVIPVDGQLAICWSIFSPKTGNYYLVDAGTAMVTEVHVDGQLKANIVTQYPQGNGTSPLDSDIGSINGNDFLYVLAPGATSVMVMSLDAPGHATRIQQLNFIDDAKNAGIEIGASNLQGMAIFVEGK